MVVEKEFEETFHQERHAEVVDSKMNLLDSELVYTGETGAVIYDINVKPQGIIFHLEVTE